MSVQYHLWKVTSSSSDVCMASRRFLILVWISSWFPGPQSESLFIPQNSIFIPPMSANNWHSNTESVSCLQGLPRSICGAKFGVRAIYESNFLDYAHHDANRAYRGQQGSMQSRYFSSKLIHIIYPDRWLPCLKETIIYQPIININLRMADLILGFFNEGLIHRVKRELKRTVTGSRGYKPVCICNEADNLSCSRAFKCLARVILVQTKGIRDSEVHTTYIIKRRVSRTLPVVISLAFLWSRNYR